MAVELTLPNLQLKVYNVYRKRAQVLDMNELASLASEHPCLIGGDFNAHHPTLNSTRTDAAGRHIHYTLEGHPTVALLNTGVPTHIRGGRLDLTFTSTVLATDADWRLHPTLTSDHYAIITTLQVNRPTIPLPPPKWNLKKSKLGPVPKSH